MCARSQHFPDVACSCATWYSVCCRVVFVGLLVATGLLNLSKHNLQASPDRHTPENAAPRQPDSPVCGCVDVNIYRKADRQSAEGEGKKTKAKQSFGLCIRSHSIHQTYMQDRANDI